MVGLTLNMIDQRKGGGWMCVCGVCVYVVYVVVMVMMFNRTVKSEGGQRVVAVSHMEERRLFPLFPHMM